MLLAHHEYMRAMGAVPADGGAAPCLWRHLNDVEATPASDGVDASPRQRHVHDDEPVERRSRSRVGLLHDRVRLARDLGVARRHVVRPQDARQLALRNHTIPIFVEDHERKLELGDAVS